MNELDLPFAEPETMGGENDAAERLRGVLSDPIVGIVALTALFFAADLLLHRVCSAGGASFCAAETRPVLTLVSFGFLTGALFLLREARARYIFPRTQMIAAAIVLFPVAHLLAGDHAAQRAAATDPALLDEVTLLGEGLATSRSRQDQIAVAVAEQGATLERQGGELAELAAAVEEMDPLSGQEIAKLAAEEAARAVEAKDAAIEAKLAEQKDTVLTEIEARTRREKALAGVGPRIAAAGPVIRQQQDAAALLQELPRDIAVLAQSIGAAPNEAEALAADDAVARCIEELKAERGPLAVAAHRLSPERYGAFLAPCAEDGAFTVAEN